MMTTSRRQNYISDINHAVLAACLSAFVMIAILLAPTVSSVIWRYEVMPDYHAERFEYASLIDHLASRY